LLLTIVLTGMASVLLQTGFLLNTRALKPDLGRLDPRRGLKKVFGVDNLVEAGKALLKLGILAWAVWSALSSLLPLLPQALFWPPARLIDGIGRAVVHLMLLVLAAQLGIALLDTGWTRWRLTQRLRMSREDLKQETKEADGDPKVKARLRHLRLARARRRMMAAVAKATVVVTNPTHYAVALAYERGGGGAPRVVAKGIDEIAARIRVTAERAGVPVIANPPLARALHAMPLDSEIPAEHFKAVAEIIAYVWRLGRISPRPGTR
jgi:flagellar biosynthetic protein FlhB